jgi:hypothetical protein
MKTSRSVPQNIVTLYDFPPEVLALPFSYLKLSDILTVERVCKIWHNVSSLDQENWKRVAYQKGIFIDDSLPIRAQVMDSFLPYCEAARKIFPTLSTIPVNKHPLIEKQMIDKQIAEMDKSEMAPLQSLLNHLKIIECPNPIHVGSGLIYDCVDMIPVWVETKQLKINEGLFLRLEEEEGFLNVFKETSDYYEKLITEFIHTHFRHHRELPLMSTENMISNMESINDAILYLAEYIFHFVKNPIPLTVFKLCALSASVDYLPIWKDIGSICHVNINTLMPLLENLKGTEWEKVFRQFLSDRDVTVDVKITYPPFIQNILKSMSPNDLKNLINEIPKDDPSDNVFIDFMNEQITKNFITSLEQSHLT